VVRSKHKLPAVLPPFQARLPRVLQLVAVDQVAAGVLGRAVRIGTQYDLSAPTPDGLTQTVPLNTGRARWSAAFVLVAAARGYGREDPEGVGGALPERTPTPRVRRAIPFSSRIPRHEICRFCGHRYSLHTHALRNDRACQYKYCQCPFFERALGAPRRP